jgi:hypothetical protein
MAGAPGTAFIANALHMNGGIGVQFSGLLDRRILRRLDGKPA